MEPNPMQFYSSHLPLCSAKRQDIIEFQKSPPAALQFQHLDRATKMALKLVTKTYVSLVQILCPALMLTAERDVIEFEMGSKVLDGYCIARRIFGTHASVYRFSSDLADAEQKLWAITKLCFVAEVPIFVHSCGSEIETILAQIAEWDGDKGLLRAAGDYIPERRQMLQTHLHCLGISVALAEYVAPVPDPADHGLVEWAKKSMYGRMDAGPQGAAEFLSGRLFRKSTDKPIYMGIEWRVGAPLKL